MDALSMLYLYTLEFSLNNIDDKSFLLTNQFISNEYKDILLIIIRTIRS